jgi:hypothetical protein
MELQFKRNNVVDEDDRLELGNISTTARER